MSNSFSLLISSPCHCSLKRLGEETERIYPEPEVALQDVRATLAGAFGEVTIHHAGDGGDRIIKINDPFSQE
jgi:hypothetical protein